MLKYNLVWIEMCGSSHHMFMCSQLCFLNAALVIVMLTDIVHAEAWDLKTLKVWLGYGFLCLQTLTSSNINKIKQRKKERNNEKNKNKETVTCHWVGSCFMCRLLVITTVFDMETSELNQKYFIQSTSTCQRCFVHFSSEKVTKLSVAAELVVPSNH